MKSYKPRIADRMLQKKLEGMGAVLIEDPNCHSDSLSSSRFPMWLKMYISGGLHIVQA